MSHIIRAVFSGKFRRTKTQPVHRYDYGMQVVFPNLDLPDAYQVHQSNSETGEAKTAIGGPDGVMIYNEYLTSGENVFLWVFLHDAATDGYTKYTVEIPVIDRPEPVDDPPTPVQQDVITQLIAYMDASVETAEEYAGDAEAWAVGQRNGQDVPAGDETYHNNAKHYAAIAEQGADRSGYAFFDVDDATGTMIVTVATNLSQEVLFTVNENNGILEVVVQ